MSWLLFSIIVICSAYFGDTSIYKKKLSNKWLPYIFRAILIIALSYLVGFGGQVSEDHISYANFFSSGSVASFSFSDIFNLGTRIGWSETGFVALSKLLALIGFGEAGYFFVLALITNAFMVNVFYRFKAPVLVFVIFITSIYYNQQMNIIRQMLAASVFLYSLKFLVEKKAYKYVVAILLTALIHFSSIFLLILTPLASTRFHHNNKSFNTILLIIWIISLLLALGGSSLNLTSIFSGVELYQKYLTTDNMIGSKAQFNLFFNFFALYYFIFNNRNRIGVYDVIFLLGCIILNFSVPLNNLLRFSYYFTPIYCAYIPTMLLLSADNKNKYAKPIFLGATIYYVAVLILSYIMNPAQIMGSEMYDWSEFFR